jgi:hypothetical protein
MRGRRVSLVWTWRVGRVALWDNCRAGSQFLRSNDQNDRRAVQVPTIRYGVKRIMTGEKMSKILSGAAAIAFGVAFHLSTANAQSSTQVGILSCKMGPSVGLIVGSRQRMSCRFTPEKGGAAERYEATMTRVGLDLGITAGGAMAWAVFAPTTGIPRGALAGNYGGASGDIALGVGVGANAMIGGSHKSIALQPVSVEGQVGVNVALGAAGFRLRAVH